MHGYIYPLRSASTEKGVFEFEFMDFLKIDYKNSVQSMTVSGFPTV